MEYHKKKFWQRGDSYQRRQKVFSMIFHDNIAIYIINNELRYHCSINYITKIASVMMWELTLDEREKTVLLNSWLDASFFGDAWWSRGYSISVDYWYRWRRYESPSCQNVFLMIFHDKYCYLYNCLTLCWVSFYVGFWDIAYDRLLSFLVLICCFRYSCWNVFSTFLSFWSSYWLTVMFSVLICCFWYSCCNVFSTCLLVSLQTMWCFFVLFCYFRYFFVVFVIYLLFSVQLPTFCNVFSTFLLFLVQILTNCYVFGTFLLFLVHLLTNCYVFGNFLLFLVQLL